MKVGMVIGIIIAIIAIVFCAVPLKTVGYSVLIDYQDTETYYETEPYQDTETYNDSIALKYKAINYVQTDVMQEHQRIVIGGYMLQDKIVEVPIYVAKVDVTNIDDIAGSFIVSFWGITPMFGQPSLTTILELFPNQTKMAECPAKSIGSWEYTVQPSTKTIVVQKTVTKYRQVEKERPVTKQRSETRYKKVTFLNYLIS